MDKEEKLARFRLSRTNQIGSITFYKLIERFGSGIKALEMLPRLANKGRLQDIKIFTKDEALKEIDCVRKIGARIIANGEEEYPEMLAQIEDAPPFITVLGNVDILNKYSLGIVGARNASVAGRKICADFSSKISEAGFVITSGLARGIDTIAHEASLKSGTVAVLAGGIDVIYPKENEKLYKDIIENNGAVVAESPFGVEPLARHFPKRNRIISGLSLGVLIVEAALKSGSLITASNALEQNREVFAVPGSPLDPRSQGCNKLLKEGACLADNPEDIIAELNSLKNRPLFDSAKNDLQGSFGFSDADNIPDVEVNTYQIILDNLSYTPVHIDELIRDTQIHPAQVMIAVLELELEGKIERHLGNKVSLI